MSDTYSISSTHLAGVLKQYWKRLSKKGIQTPYGLFKALPTAMFQEAQGTTVNLSRYGELPDQTAVVSGEVTRPEYRALKTGKVTASIVTIADVVAPSEIAQLTSMDQLNALPNLLTRQARRSIDLYLAKNVTAYARMLRADLDTTYQIQITTTADGASDGTTFKVADATLDQADDFFNGALATIVDEEFNVIESSYITDWDGTSDPGVGTVSFSYQVITGTRIQITHFTGVADQAADHLDLDCLREAQVLMHHSGYFGDGYEYPGGGYKFVMDALNYGDMLADSNIVNLFIQKEKEKGIREYGWGGKLLSLDPEITMRPFRCAVGGAGTYAANGVCDIALLLSQAAAVKMPLEKSDVEIIIKGKKEGGHANPLELFSSYGWKIKLAAGVDKPAAMIGIACGQGAPTL